MADGVLEADEAVGAVVEQLHGGATPEGSACGEFGHRAGADDDDFGGTNTGESAEHGAAAIGTGEQFARDQDGAVARNLAHGTHERHDAVVVRDEVPGDGGRFLCGEGFEKTVLLDVELEGADEGLAHAHQLHLIERRRLHLDDNSGRENLLPVVHNARTGLTVIRVRVVRRIPSAGLHKHLVAAGNEQRHGFRDQGHPLFLQAVLLRNADNELAASNGHLQQLFRREQRGLPRERPNPGFLHRSRKYTIRPADGLRNPKFPHPIALRPCGDAQPQRVRR